MYDVDDKLIHVIYKINFKYYNDIFQIFNNVLFKKLQNKSLFSICKLNNRSNFLHVKK